MMRIGEYLGGLSREIGSRWNRFWFEPSDGFDLCVIRILVGLLALVWQLSYTPDLIRWFGPDGWFDGGVLQQWLTAQSTLGHSGRLSYLFRQSETSLWIWHFAGSLVLLAFALGWFTRVAAVLSLLVILSYVHRAPFVCGVTEMVLTMLVTYLCLAPSGRALSLDALRSERRRPLTSVWYTIARRLIQVHLVAIYAIMALSKLGGEAGTWWNGEAIWWLAAQPLARDVDLTSLRDVPLLLNLWTYGVLIAEFSFVLFVWSPWLRPLVLFMSALSWLSLSLATGNPALPLTMLIANLAFVPASTWRELFPQRRTMAVS